MIIQCFFVLLKLIIFKGKIWTKSGSVVQRCFFQTIFFLIFFVLKLKWTLYLENISTDWLHLCVCECTKSGSVVWLCVFPEHLILKFVRLKVKVKVDLLNLTLKLMFHPNYFQILRQKNPNPSIWKTLKFGRETILVQTI
jgi:hypothetical protein